MRWRGSLAGFNGWHPGDDWGFFKPIYINDYITPKSTIAGFNLLRTKFAGKSPWRYQRAEFYNQREELVARAYSWPLRRERKTARTAGKYAQINLPHPWSEEEPTRIENEICAEEVRGLTVR